MRRIIDWILRPLRTLSRVDRALREKVLAEMCIEAAKRVAREKNMPLEDLLREMARGESEEQQYE